MRIFISILCLFILSCFHCICLADDNKDTNWGVTPQDAENKKKEVSELIWEAETTNEIQNEYGSEESSYFNNRGGSSAYDDDIGGDSFNSFGY